MHARVGEAIVRLARDTGAPSLFVVGTGKNVGKTVTMRAIYEACVRSGVTPGLTSIGRDGEAVDASDSQAKPRLRLHPGTVIATARDVLPNSPATELLDLSPLPTAAGMLVIGRVRTPAAYELVGPPTASGIRAIVGVLLRYAPFAIVDGAVDRIAALAGGDDAVVVACGAAASATPEDAVDDVRALVARLRVEAYDGREESILVEGALTPSVAAELLRVRETRTIVVRDPTQIALSGRAALHALGRLRVRALRPLRVVAATVASIGRDRSFEPRAFARAVAAATGLPTFDVYAAEQAA
jgi:hypothetical protein